MVERAKDWMDQAQGDLEHARHSQEGDFYDWACFSAQQAGEKALKAVFQRMGAEAWGHSVADLLQELAESQEVPDGLVEAALELDKTYISARYPNAHPAGSPRRRYTQQEAKRMIGHAQKIVELGQNLLSSLEPPETD